MVWLDIPTLDCLNNPNGSWEAVGRFPDKATAVAFIREHFGPCDDEGRLSLLQENDDDNSVTEVEFSEVADAMMTRNAELYPPEKECA